MSIPRVICIGHTSLDRVFRVPAWTTGSAKIRATSFRESGGGMAANAAAAIAMLGGNVEFWGPAGDDRIATVMADELTRLGVDAGGMQRIPGTESSHSAILVDDAGERLIIGMRGDALASDGAWLPIERIEFAGAVLADVRWPAGARRALAAAREWGVPAILDADVAEPDVLRELVGLADHAVFSEPGLALFGPPDAPVEASLRVAIDSGARTAIVTRGADGAVWMTAGDEHARHHPALAVERVVDTTGAGDVFHGAYALRIAEGAALDEAVRFAIAAASLKCRASGTRSAPTRARVEAAIA